MNIFFRELKSHRNSLIFWSAGMFALVYASMVKYGALSKAGQSINGLMSSFPKSVQMIFGISGFDLTKADGYYGVLFLYIALMATIHAMTLGADIIGKEERDRTSEFLFPKPVSRAEIVTPKLLAALTNLIVFNAVTWVSSVIIVSQYQKDGGVNHEISVLMLGLFFLQLIFLSIGAVLASASRKPKMASESGMAILLFTYILAILVNMSDKIEWLKYLTPFKYFDAKSMIDTGRIDPVFTVLSIAIITILISGTYFFYRKRDLQV
jgi:ABC-2 type transport system permease protein